MIEGNKCPIPQHECGGILGGCLESIVYDPKSYQSPLPPLFKPLRVYEKGDLG